TAQRRAETLDQFAALLRPNVAGGKVAHLAGIDMNEVAADGPVARAEANPHSGRLQRSAAGVDLKRVITEQAERGDVAGGCQRRRHIIGAADDARAGEGIHVWLVSSLDRSAVVQRRLRLV